jgi:YfiH family protein
MILDPVKKAISLVHAGWKGTAAKIAANSLKLMADAFGTRPGDCLAAIAPSIGPCCYEIDEPVITAFRDRGLDPAPFTGPGGGGRWKLDLRRLNRSILVEAGVRPDNISVAGLCTSCRPDLFFSYRAQSGLCGRMASLMVLK